jgi:poly(hydroxyalkanoate) depolymerase family esterase
MPAGRRRLETLRVLRHLHSMSSPARSAAGDTDARSTTTKVSVQERNIAMMWSLGLTVVDSESTVRSAGLKESEPVSTDVDGRNASRCTPIDVTIVPSEETHSMKAKTKALSVLAAVGLGIGVGAVALAPPALAASLTEVTNFGTNPTGLRMFEYVPNNVSAHPAILVVNHYCGGSAQAMFSGTEFASLADQNGFIVVYPSVTRSSLCFDVSSPGALTHNGNSDPVAIVSMVGWEVQHRNGDSSRVYTTGLSSGAMMTNVLLGDYPDVFKAGAAFAGVPFACFATTDGSMWNTACANGQISKTPQQWGDLARGAFPGYTGPRPRMQLWHGTADTTLFYPNFGEEIKQWTNVLGVSQTPSFTDHPQASWTRTRYGGTGTTSPVEGISVQNGSHNILAGGMASLALQFMGLIGGVQQPPTTGPPTTGPPTSQPPTAGGGGGACRVGDTISAWNTGLTSNLTITNTGSTTINGWSLVFTLPGGQVITNGWNATYSPTSGQVTAKNVSYNGTLAPGASTTIGFQADHTGNTARPASFTLNGAACTIA